MWQMPLEWWQASRTAAKAKGALCERAFAKTNRG
jgi:hypothetical protein